MNTNHEIRALLFCCLLLQMAQPARAQLEGKIIGPKFHTYHIGDDTAWARPEFDDSDWVRTQPPMDLWSGIVWRRDVVEVDSTLWNVPLGLSMVSVAAVEFYLDGELLYQFGKVGRSRDEEEPRYGFDRPLVFTFRPSLNTVAGKSRHTLAFRYSSFFRESPIWSGSGRGFTYNIHDLDQLIALRENLKRKVTIHQMVLMGASLAFSLSHFLLFVFYPSRSGRANLYYAALTACFAVTVYFWFYVFPYPPSVFITDPEHYLWLCRLLFLAFTLMMLFALRLTYFLIYPRLPKIFLIFCCIGFGLTLWLWFRPFIVWKYLIVLYIVNLAEIMRAIVASRITKDKTSRPIGEGGWIILLGLVPFCLVAVYYLLNVFALVPVPWSFFDFPAPFYAILLLMISMSVFLARNFALTNKNLEAQLIQVKALSEKTIQQEREKAQLEAENARKTKELEEARQLQLSMLPKNPPALPHLDIAAEMKTATEVGGDYYDFKVHDDGVLTIAVGDATGHGMQAGTMVAATKSLFNALADEPEPASILQKATKALKEMGYRKMYMALTVAKIQNHQMLVAAAGMPYTLIHRAAGGGVEEIALKAMPLGSFPNFKYEQKKIALEPGDTVLFLSDGLEEMFDPQGEILGAARVKELVAETGQKPSEQVIAHLKNAGKAWANGRVQEDDVTMVVVRIRSDDHDPRTQN